MDRNNAAVNWLLEDSNPAIKYRSLKELFGEKANNQDVVTYVNSFLPKGWKETKGLWFTYYLNAIAECGLTGEDMSIPKGKALLLIENEAFGFGCGDFMLLRAMIMLGYHNEPLIIEQLNQLNSKQLPDGGFLCLRRLEKLNYTPKSCVKSNNWALLLCSECKKRGISLTITNNLLNYYWEHNLFYKKSDLSELILNARGGWRTIDTFHPFEVMRVGLHNIVEAFCALGYGNDNRLLDAWNLMNCKKNEKGQYLLEGTLTKSYLPKERIGRPSKWVTFYSLLAQKNMENNK